MFDFPLEVSSLEEVPENYRPLYGARSEEDPTPVLDSTLAERLDNSKLMSALDKERKLHNTIKKDLQAWKIIGESPDAIQTSIKEMQDQLAQGSDNKVNWEKMKADLEAGKNRAIAEKDDELKSMRHSLESYIIDSQAVASIVENKGIVKLLLPHVKEQVRVIKDDSGNYVTRVVDSAGDPRGNSQGGFMTIKELVSEMKNQEDYARAFEATKISGGGTAPANQRPAAQATPLGNPNDKRSSVDKIRAGLDKRG